MPFWQNFGIGVRGDSALPYDYNPADYTSTDPEKIKSHLELLKDILKKEDERLTTIESKNSQIISYTAIIFSSISLFTPLFLEKVPSENGYIKTALIILIIVTLAFYFLVIHNAIKNYGISKFFYSGSDPNNVIKYQANSVSEFNAIEVRDILYSINQNLKSNCVFRRC